MVDNAAVSEQEWDAWRSFMSMRSQLDLTLERQLQRDGDISAADYGVLVALFDSDEKQLRGRELGKRLGWEKSRVSHQVSRMEKRGLVERRNCDTDARGTWIGITADGSRAFLSAMREHSATLRKNFFDVLTPEELAVLKSGFDRVLDKILPTNCETDA